MINSDKDDIGLKDNLRTTFLTLDFHDAVWDAGLDALDMSPNSVVENQLINHITSAVDVTIGDGVSVIGHNKSFRNYAIDYGMNFLNDKIPSLPNSRYNDLINTLWNNYAGSELNESGQTDTTNKPQE